MRKVSPPSSQGCLARSTRASLLRSSAIHSVHKRSFLNRSRVDTIVKNQCNNILEQQKHECLQNVSKISKRGICLPSSQFSHVARSPQSSQFRASRGQLLKPYKSFVHSLQQRRNASTSSIFQTLTQSNGEAKISSWNDLKQLLPNILFADAKGFGNFKKGGSKNSSGSSSDSKTAANSEKSSKDAKPVSPKQNESKETKSPKKSKKKESSPKTKGKESSDSQPLGGIFGSFDRSNKDKDGNNNKDGENKDDKGGFESFFEKVPLWVWAIPILGILLGPNFSFKFNENQITFQQFRIHMLEQGIVDHIEVVNKQIARVFLQSDLDTRDSKYNLDHDDRLSGKSVYGKFSPGTVYEFNIGSVASFEEKLEQAQLDIGIEPTDWVPVQYVNEISVRDGLLSLITSGPVLTLLVFWWIIRMFRRSSSQLMGGSGGGRGGLGGGMGGLFDISKANFKVINKGEKVKTKFADVAGLQNAKDEVMEFVKFLKDPESYTKLGARIPKGALLVGPPGTGKTLLARAVAGEAECPFFSISGSDFVEMFVGVGPSRVRNLFEEARKNTPCIVFIDEIDAVGRKRGRGGFAGGNDERENTLNQLLVEMDGFKADSSIVVLAGTNRSDILDSALTRPGRFDRQIQIEKPDIKGRIEIFKVHLKKIKLAVPPEDIAQRMATLTPGFSGADIANVVNEAALRAARKGKEAVDIHDFYQANDRVMAGLEKRIVMSEKEREMIAHHESGHAVAGWFLEYADPLLKVTIIPRASGALGFAQYLPKEVTLYNKNQLTDMVRMALGGRAAEQIFYDRVSTGASDDLNKVTKIAYSLISIYGMNDKLGNLSFPPENNNDGGIVTYRPYSEKTAEMIDEEASTFVRKAYDDTIQLLTEKKDLVAALAKKLLEEETLGHDQIVEVLGPRPFPNDSYTEFLASTREFAQKYGEEAVDTVHNDVSAESEASGDAADGESGEKSESGESAESAQNEGETGSTASEEDDSELNKKEK